MQTTLSCRLLCLFAISADAGAAAGYRLMLVPHQRRSGTARSHSAVGVRNSCSRDRPASLQQAQQVETRDEGSRRHNSVTHVREDTVVQRLPRLRYSGRELGQRISLLHFFAGRRLVSRATIYALLDQLMPRAIPPQGASRRRCSFCQRHMLFMAAPAQRFQGEATLRRYMIIFLPAGFQAPRVGVLREAPARRTHRHAIIML